MDIKDIAEALVNHCKNGTEAEALSTLYSDAIVSVEAQPNPQTSGISEGMEALHGKHAWWAANFDVHAQEVEGPFVFRDDKFAVKFSIDATQKESGTREKMSEIAVYHVKDGKIVREEFFYSLG